MKSTLLAASMAALSGVGRVISGKCSTASAISTWHLLPIMLDQERYRAQVESREIRKHRHMSGAFFVDGWHTAPHEHELKMDQRAARASASRRHHHHRSW